MSMSCFEVVKLLLDTSCQVQGDDDDNQKATSSADGDDESVVAATVERIAPPALDADEGRNHGDDDIAWYPNFVACLLENRPCIFPAEFTSDWRCRKDWVNSEVGGPSWTFLSRAFGESEVPVANCKVKHYNSQLKMDTKFADYLDYWRTLVVGKHDYDKYENLYLKDWHFVRDFSDYGAYRTPFCFSSDWLNEFWTSSRISDKNDDYRFVYMGPKGSWTPLHTDVFDSYSWSANICGLKKWIMFPPNEGDNLKDVHGNLAYDVLAPEMNDKTVYPNYGKTKRKIEIVQRCGEVIFVPSRWYHQVRNLEDTISVNHNWFNAFNVTVIWQSMKNMLVQVQREIEDCKEMDGWNDQCQLILKSTYGMDFDEFKELLQGIATSRLALIGQWMDGCHTFEVDCHADIMSEGGRRAIDVATWILDLSSIERTLRAMNDASPGGKSELSSNLVEEIASVLEQCRKVIKITFSVP